MRIDYQFRPLDRWPFAPTANRRSRYTFKSSFDDTLNLLAKELQYLKAQRIVFQIVIKQADLRIDGMLRAHAQPLHPGVIVSFDSRTAGPLSFPCDSCELWQHNLRSIGMGLGALRAVDRYGVTKRAEQYKGWAALPSPEGDGALWKIPVTLADVRSLVGQVFEKAEYQTNVQLMQLVRYGQRKFHPDQPGGDPRMSRAFNAAI